MHANKSKEFVVIARYLLTKRLTIANHPKHENKILKPGQDIGWLGRGYHTMKQQLTTATKHDKTVILLSFVTFKCYISDNQRQIGDNRVVTIE